MILIQIESTLVEKLKDRGAIQPKETLQFLINNRGKPGFLIVIGNFGVIKLRPSGKIQYSAAYPGDRF